MKNLIKDLEAHYCQKKCVHCGKDLDSIVTDETTFDPDDHAGIYKNNPQGWYPHYDVEYLCDQCSHYERYTHDVDGTILAKRINKVLFDFTSNKFAIIEADKIIPAGRLPESVEYGSPTFQKYLDEVLEKAYS